MFRLSFLFAISALGILCAKANDEIIIPAPLHPGDTIAIITPASAVDSMVVVRAQKSIEDMGFATKLMPHVHGKWLDGSYSAPDSARAADIMEAFCDPNVKAIICSRGGYGSTRLLDRLNADTIAAHPKWLVGYSDITALHAFLNSKAKMASIHGPMLAAFAQKQPRKTKKSPVKYKPDESAHRLIDFLLSDHSLEYTLPSNFYNNPGTAEGILVGGNLLVTQGLSGTPYDNLNDSIGTIIFFEDVGEKIYAIERFLLRLHLSGTLQNVKGIIFGEFTEYKKDSDFETMEQMIHARLMEWGYYDKENFPIAFGFPGGHGDDNYPLVLGAKARLKVTLFSVSIREL